MGKTREDGVGNGQAAWNAPEEKYNNHTKEARRAYHEKLHITNMKSGDDPDDFLYTMDGFRERLDDMGQPVPDERYEDIILQAIPAKYEMVRTTSYERRDFHLADIRRMMITLYIDCLSRPNNSPLVAGRGVAMQATGGDDSAIKCHYCGNPGHRQISDEHTRWTDIYLFKSKDCALHAFQSFVQSMVIPSGVRIERLRADKGKGPQLLNARASAWGRSGSRLQGQQLHHRR